MPRLLLPEDRVHPAVRQAVAEHHRDLIESVEQALARHELVVVGMAQNPFPKKVRRALDAAGIPHHDLDFGSYFSDWRRRTALKMWSGWPTFPMVFVRGQLIGGADDTLALLASGELKRLLGR